MDQLSPTSSHPSVNATRVALAITGMTCAACATRLEKALSAVAGVTNATINLALERADVRFDLARTQPQQLIAAVRDAGYDATIANDDSTLELASNDGRALPISIVLTLPLVAQMLAHTFSFGFHLSPWMELALATPVQFILGARFYSSSYRALRARAANMDVLVALGTSAAYFYSLYLVTARADMAAGQLYFEGSAVIITLILLGKWLEARAKRSTTEAIRSLMALRPETARVVRSGVETEIPIDQVRISDRIIIRPGEKIPTDGLVEDGASECDEALITGESLPVEKTKSDKVIAGAINGTGRLLVRATAVGADTTLAKIVALVQNAQTGKAPVQRLVDRISAIFVPIIVVISIVTFLAWVFTGGTIDQAFVAAVSVLVIACPCALGLATPTALVTGMGAAAHAGILIKDIEALERAHAVTTVVFDKTGTLTQGKLVLAQFNNVHGDELENLSIAMSIQTASEHPIAKAIIAFGKSRGAQERAVAKFKSHTGFGIEGSVDGKTVLMGNAAFVNASGIATAALNSFANAAYSVIVLVVNIEIHAVFCLADKPRQESEGAVRALKQQGIKTILLSGDSQAVAQHIAQAVGIEDVRGGVRPETKSTDIRALQQAGVVVAMVGDGVNDAPALATADVGIAMGSGTDVAMATAGITLLRPNPALVPAALDISRATWRKIRQNLFWAFVYNLIGVPLAAFGFLTPALAGAAMALSSVSVVSNSLLLKRWRPRAIPD
ncbi:MAG: cadmium-translocating P-type ATPase [Rhodospirillaceae bacterium]|nr:cadmium-translocating P-type ATPase [Rhodospirillaceae bacterium]